MSNIIVLGAGMVGRAIAIDLTSRHNVTLTDLNPLALSEAQAKCPPLKTRLLDVVELEELRNAISSFDLVVCAVPGFLGFQTLRAIIAARKNVIDISFFPEDCLELDALAKENGVTAIVDCGVAPGLDNLILGYWDKKLKLTDFECLVGGLPKVKKWPFAYKAPFSPIDVIEEYTRPARYVENGKEIIREPLTDVEHVEFEGVGTLESFNSDGLRSIIQTMPHIPNMKEKTLRYPGHVEYIRVLKESGFFSEDKVSGTEMSALDFTSKILFNEWKLGAEEEEITVMRVTVRGTDAQGEMQEVVYDIHDEYDQKTKTASMSRTTGYTATAAANMFLDGLFTKNGVFPPELIGGADGCFEYVVRYLAERGVDVKGG
ncbi:MAG: saccharopine dehydrogenase C-terminal domain-containing protein [Cyclobacteriaceae bacterium]